MSKNIAFIILLHQNNAISLFNHTKLTIPSTPQSLRDSPRWGHWGPDSPDPLRRFALRAHYLFTPPSHCVTAPGGGTGDRIPQTPCVASPLVAIRFSPLPSR